MTFDFINKTGNFKCITVLPMYRILLRAYQLCYNSIAITFCQVSISQIFPTFPNIRVFPIPENTDNSRMGIPVW